MIIFDRFAHYVWGRRFRLPTVYVHAQAASSLAPGYLRGDFSICHLAIGWFYAEESGHAEVGRRKRLPHPHSWAVVCGAGPGDGQGCFWAGLVARSAYRTGGGGCALVWRQRQAFLPASRLGDHAESCARALASEDRPVRDHALVERFYGSTGQFNLAPHRRALLAR